MFNELLKNVMNLGIITEDDVKRLTAIELMLLIIERINGLLLHVNNVDGKLDTLLEDVNKITIEELNKWTQDGTFDELINQTALNEVNDRLDEANAQLSREIDVERKRIDSFNTLKDGSTTGDAELIDARIGVDGITYPNLGSAIRTQFGNLNHTLYTNDMFFDEIDVSLYEVKKGYGLTGIESYTKAIIEPSNNDNFNTVAIIPVRKDEIYKVTGQTFYNVYNCVGLVLSDTKWNFEHPQSNINIKSGYDIWGGVRENRWADFIDYEVTIPDGVNYMYVQAFKSCKKKQRVDKITVLNQEIDKINDQISSTKKLPVICFDFDEASLDRRYEILKEYGLTGTFAQNQQPNVMRTLVKNGFDISLYSGLGDRPNDYQSDEAIELWKAYIQNGIDMLEGWGIINPVMYSCYGHKGGYALDEALKSFNFKYQRCTYGVNKDGSDYYVSDTAKHDEFQQCPLLLNDLATSENIIKAINNKVDRGDELIMLMMHTFDTEPNITEEIFTNVASHVADLVSQNKCLCLNMNQYYAHFYQEQAKKDDYSRIMGSIVKNRL